VDPVRDVLLGPVLNDEALGQMERHRELLSLFLRQCEGKVDTKQIRAFHFEPRSELVKNVDSEHTLIRILVPKQTERWLFILLRFLGRRFIGSDGFGGLGSGRPLKLSNKFGIEIFRTGNNQNRKTRSKSTPKEATEFSVLSKP